MRDEYPKTKKFLRDLRRVHDRCMDIITGRSASRAFPDHEDKMLSECQNIIDALYEQDADVAPGIWPLVIQELLDSVDYSNQLQASYNGWMKILGNGVWIKSEEDLNRLLKHTNINPEDVSEDSKIGQCLRLLRQSRSLMLEVWYNIQDLKLEYDLHDDDDYRDYSSFMAFGEETEYPNGPDETKSSSCGETESTNSESNPVQIGNDIIIIFKNEESAREYFSWKHHVNDAKQWGKRYDEYGKPKDKRTRGDLKRVFEFIKLLHPEYCWEQKDLEKFQRYVGI